MKRKFALSVGIPAYNEAENITHLLDSLLRQKQDGFRLVEIIVVSDGSTDGTNELVKQYKKGPIKLIEGRSRLGQQVRQNQLLETFKGDVLAVIEADILLADENVLAELVRPFCENNPNLGMVVGQGLPIEPQGFYERILFNGLEFKRALFADWKKGINVYTAGGHSMKAMSRQFTQKLRWPKHVPEDAYTYFKLKELGLGMIRNPKARAYMRNVTTFGDRKKQVKKFISGKAALEAHFPKGWLQSEYMISPTFVLRHLIGNFRKNPVWTTLFLGELVTNRIAVLRRSAFSALHEIYSSSKKLVECQPKVEVTGHKPSISVGIPAYNEEENIGRLLESLLKQKITKGFLKEIIVVSDGSTDKTDSIIKAAGSKKISLIVHQKRMGQAVAQNDIAKHATGDVLVLLNGDVLPHANDFLDRIIEPIIYDKSVGLVGADTISSEPKTLFERVIAGSHEIKKRLYKEIDGGNNIYLCHGRGRALRRDLYKKIVWAKGFPEDAYSYIFCRMHGYKFVFCEDANVIFRSPTNINDHIKQSLRFMAGRQKIETEYKELTKKSYQIPLGVYFKVGVISAISSPVVLIGYVLINLYARILFLRKRNYSSIWDISKSSKKVVYG
ncbi:MAG: Glycosyl transferase family 2 [Candidatus Curtissbacteria bacterium GW2011_GWA1_40_16]|uniref:Glycosyl transferase family 2 n=1 Tax=Candidatus Curtissbacteria bacterium GW2011_GWA1_40_16 TaxID=1618405 RepID=A0A0G0RDS0_9BACT|nr:MAG: Glycosyl transferase family 2 [Candidatus Curtissbacteria bacterium GW2011_GWA1_40_16]